MREGGGEVWVLLAGGLRGVVTADTWNRNGSENPSLRKKTIQ